MSAISRLRRGHRIKPRVKRGPVNTMMVMACGFATISVNTWPGLDGEFLPMGLSGVTAMLAVTLTSRAYRLVKRDYRLRYGIAVSELETDDHGSARQSTPEERAARGMNSPKHGEFYGLDDQGNPVFRPPNAFLGLITMPPGGGKTSNLVINSIFQRAIRGDSILIADIKADLAPSLIRGLKELGKEVWVVNPANLHVPQVGRIDVGLYQPIIDALYGGGEQRKQALKLASDYAVLHYPVIAEDKNQYFSIGSRRMIVVVILLSAYLDPSDCTPTAVYRVLTDPAALLKLCRQVQKFQTVYKSDEVLEDLKRECRNLLHRAAKNEENFASFLEGASQKFLSFAPSGMLGDYGAGAIHSLSAIRDRQIIVFIMTPLSAMRECSDFISLINHGVVAAVKAKPDGHPLHICGEEALNYRFNDLVADLETLRQLSVTIDLYIQSQAGLERHYGKTAAAAINAYADVRITAALNDLTEAKQVAAMLSSKTVKRQDISYQASVTELSIANREMARPLMSAGEILTMRKNEAWLFVSGQHPTHLTMLSYAQMSPLRDWVDPSPITGTRLHAETVLTVDYDRKGGSADA